MRSISPTILVASVALLTHSYACDSKKKSTAKPDAGPPPGKPYEQAGDAPLEASGAVADEELTLEWKHTFDGNAIVDMAVCKDDVLTVTEAGRIVAWNAKMMTPIGVVDAFGAASAIDVRSDEAVVGTTTGRFLAGDCSFVDRSYAPNEGFHVTHLTIDPRSKTRALVVMRRPGKPDEDAPAFAVASHVDLHTGKSVRRPYEVPMTPNSAPIGFVDYRGELWLGVVDEVKARYWYLERFDRDQPEVNGIDDTFRFVGLAQIQDDIWGFGSHGGEGVGLIARFDGSAKLKTMWDGKEAWFGEQPGGDIPKGEPVTRVIQNNNSLLVVTPDDIRRTDLELRRWRKLEAGSNQKGAFANVRAVVKKGKARLIGTSNGIARVKNDQWSLWRVPAYRAPKDKFDRVSRSAFWGDFEYAIDDDGHLLRAQRDASKDEKRPHKIRGEIEALFVDETDRLWVFGRDDLHLVSRDEDNVTKRSWSTEAFGLDSARVTGFASGNGGETLAVRMRAGDVFKFRLVPTQDDDSKTDR